MSKLPRLLITTALAMLVAPAAFAADGGKSVTVPVMKIDPALVSECAALAVPSGTVKTMKENVFCTDDLVFVVGADSIGSPVYTYHYLDPNAVPGDAKIGFPDLVASAI